MKSLPRRAKVIITAKKGESVKWDVQKTHTVQVLRAQVSTNLCPCSVYKSDFRSVSPSKKLLRNICTFRNFDIINVEPLEATIRFRLIDFFCQLSIPTTARRVAFHIRAWLFQISHVTIRKKKNKRTQIHQSPSNQCKRLSQLSRISFSPCQLRGCRSTQTSSDPHNATKLPSLQGFKMKTSWWGPTISSLPNPLSILY